MLCVSRVNRINILTAWPILLRHQHILYIDTRQLYCPPFTQSPGRPPVLLRRWLAMFEDWLLAIGFPETEATAARKAAILS